MSTTSHRSDEATVLGGHRRHAARAARRVRPRRRRDHHGRPRSTTTWSWRASTWSPCPASCAALRRRVNFAEFIADLELDEIIALTVGQLVDYVVASLRDGGADLAMIRAGELDLHVQRLPADAAAGDRRRGVRARPAHRQPGQLLLHPRPGLRRGGHRRDHVRPARPRPQRAPADRLPAGGLRRRPARLLDALEVPARCTWSATPSAAPSRSVWPPADPERVASVIAIEAEPPVEAWSDGSWRRTREGQALAGHRRGDPLDSGTTARTTPGCPGLRAGCSADHDRRGRPGSRTIDDELARLRCPVLAIFGDESVLMRAGRPSSRRTWPTARWSCCPSRATRCWSSGPPRCGAGARLGPCTPSPVEAAVGEPLPVRRAAAGRPHQPDGRGRGRTAARGHRVAWAGHAELVGARRARTHWSSRAPSRRRLAPARRADGTGGAEVPVGEFLVPLAERWRPACGRRSRRSARTWWSPTSRPSPARWSPTPRPAVGHLGHHLGRAHRPAGRHAEGGGWLDGLLAGLRQRIGDRQYGGPAVLAARRPGVHHPRAARRGRAADRACAGRPVDRRVRSTRLPLGLAGPAPADGAGHPGHGQHRRRRTFPRGRGGGAGRGGRVQAVSSTPAGVLGRRPRQRPGPRPQSPSWPCCRGSTRSSATPGTTPCARRCGTACRWWSPRSGTTSRSSPARWSTRARASGSGSAEPPRRT